MKPLCRLRGPTRRHCSGSQPEQQKPLTIFVRPAWAGKLAAENLHQNAPQSRDVRLSPAQALTVRPAKLRRTAPFKGRCTPEGEIVLPCRTVWCAAQSLANASHPAFPCSNAFNREISVSAAIWTAYNPWKCAGFCACRCKFPKHGTGNCRCGKQAFTLSQTAKGALKNSDPAPRTAAANL